MPGLSGWLEVENPDVKTSVSLCRFESCPMRQAREGVIPNPIFILMVVFEWKDEERDFGSGPFGVRFPCILRDK